MVTYLYDKELYRYQRSDLKYNRFSFRVHKPNFRSNSYITFANYSNYFSILHGLILALHIFIIYSLYQILSCNLCAQYFSNIKTGARYK
jgi:hypothetical protein